jgi:4-alpha-glucanotransferase
VWCHRDLFELDAQGFSGAVAGVPPDYFAKEGQLWGNPLYDWKALAKTGYAWWIDRLTALNNLVDIVRIDHFRGFEAFWSVPVTEKTAINGHWVKGPGLDFFKAVAKALPGLEIIAEDLGITTPEVDKLRKDAGFPGMRVLQFGFPLDDANDHHALHMHTQDSVVYCGTHDNDTTVGWYLSLDEAQRDRVRRYLSIDGNEIAWQLMRAAESSVAELCIVTVQDLLSRGSDARMNVPGIAKGNWAWRMTDALPGWIADRLRDMVEVYGRASWQQKKSESN